MGLDDLSIEQLVWRYLEVHSLGNVLPRSRPLSEIVEYNLSIERAEERIQLLAKCTAKDLDGLNVLDIGSGFGLFVAMTRQQGAVSYGVEPDSIACEISYRVLRQRGVSAQVIVRSVGEALPFADETFDVVFSDEVLEHAQRPSQVMGESARVLKHGGYLHFVIPNYASFWEGHYSLLWFPRLPRFLAKLYVRACGRDPDFIDTLQFITPGYMQRVLARHEDMEALDWGIAAWEQRFMNLGFSRWSDGRLTRAVRAAHRVGVARLVTALGRRCEFYTPIVLTARKRPRHAAGIPG